MGNVYRRALLLSFLLLTACATGSSSPLLWQGDFETGNLTQWSYLLNPKGLSLEAACVYEGEYAGRVTLSGDPAMLWHGNAELNRSEFNYKPAAGAVDEGKDTYFGWSFYLEQPLTERKHEIGYWESENTYQQMFRFNIKGETLSFQKSTNPTVFWQKAHFAKAGVWRDVALHVHWSTDPAQGFVSVWLDGEKRATQYFQTLHASGEAMFTQLGLLRTQQDTIETILIDNVREGDSMADVLAAFNADKNRHCQ